MTYSNLILLCPEGASNVMEPLVEEDRAKLMPEGGGTEQLCQAILQRTPLLRCEVGLLFTNL